MSRDLLVAKLDSYENVDILISVENPSLTVIDFGIPHRMAEDDSDTKLKVSVKGVDFEKYCNVQEHLYSEYLQMINHELLNSNVAVEAQIKLHTWKQILLKLLRQINRPIKESSITIGFKLDDQFEDYNYYGNQAVLDKYFLECQGLLSSVILTPLLDYLKLLENDLSNQSNYDVFKKSLASSQEPNEKQRKLFCSANLSQPKLLKLFELLKIDLKLIHQDSAQEVFFGLSIHGHFVDKIKWTGTKGSFRTFISFLKEVKLIPDQPWTLIRESFTLTLFSEYLENPKVSSGKYAVDETFRNKLVAFYKAELY